jgi:hypothetical protein
MPTGKADCSDRSGNEKKTSEGSLSLRQPLRHENFIERAPEDALWADLPNKNQNLSLRKRHESEQIDWRKRQRTQMCGSIIRLALWDSYSPL